MSENIAGDVKEAFSGKRGKVLLIGGGLAVVAYVVWFRKTNTDTTGEAVGDPAAGVEGAVTSGSSTGRIPQTDPEVGNDEIGSKPTKILTNIAWLAEGTAFLIGRGTPAANAYTALSKALNGEQVTTTEAAWVSQAITGVGAPPEGMPPLQSAPPPTTAPPTTTTPKPTTAYRGYGWYQVRKGDSITSITKKYRITRATLVLYNGSGALNRLTPGEWLKVRSDANPSSGYKGK